MVLVVFPFHAGDAKQLHNLFRWMKQLSGDLKTHYALLVPDNGTDWNQVVIARELAYSLFKEVSIASNENSVTGWPQGPNDLFLTAAQHIQTAGWGHWLWMETDCIPLHREWLDILEGEYGNRNHNYPFMGDIYSCDQPNLPNQMVSGIAVYPPNAFTLLHDLIEREPEKGFDVSTSHFTATCTHPTNRIFHYWGEKDLPPTFPRPGTSPWPRNGFTLGKPRPNAVLFHRNKDGTLIERLREKMGYSVPTQEPDRQKITVRRTASLGDVLSATVVAKKLTNLGYDVTFQAHASTHCILRRVPGIAHIEEPQGSPEIDLDNAYEKNSNRRSLHFAEMFVGRANEQLTTKKLYDARNFAPRMELSDADRQAAIDVLQKYPKPWILICPRSNSWVNRTIPDATWVQVAAILPGTKFWLALHPAPKGDVVDLNVRHFDAGIGFLGCVDILATVDTGPMHVAAALGTPCVVVEQASSPDNHLSDQQDWIKVSPPLSCLNCQDNICRIDANHPPCQRIEPMAIADAVIHRLSAIRNEGVSVVVCTWKPSAQKLNHCLANVVDQVQEVIVVQDSAGMLPQGAMQHGKIRYLRSPKGNIGYGRKANYGARHTNNKYILFLNDDLYLAPDAVAKMKEVMTEGVGIVAHELRYPNGLLQHGGTFRPLGVPGWGHLDLKHKESRIKEPVEMENVTGASILVRREAFYKAAGFDEDFYLYCEDNHFCLAVRQAGYKIIYTPHAKGVHEESQSTSVTPNIYNIMQESQRTLVRKWGWWFELNKNNAGLGVFE